MNTNVQIPRELRRTEPYRALAIGVVLRALRDASGTGSLQRDDIHDTGVTRNALLWWTRRAEWPVRWVEQAITQPQS